jgi:hypothetical protein
MKNLAMRCMAILLVILIMPIASGCPWQSEQEPAASLAVYLSFPDGAPPLNREAELVCTVDAPARSAKNLGVSVSLPEALELVSGDLSWSGDVAEGDEIEIIRAVIRSVEIGHWRIELNRYLDPEENRGFGFQNPDPYFISIYENLAEWGTTPPWYEGHDNLVSVYRVDDPLANILVYMSISHPPLLNEPAELLCTVSPRIDFPNFKAQLVLPEGAALVDGNLEWQGDLEAGVPVALWAKIIFRETGSWRIDVGAWRWIDGEYSWHVMDSVYLIIGVNHSKFGEPPKEDLSDLPPPPSISLDD